MSTKIASLFFMIFISFSVFSAEKMDLPIDEFEFIKQISGKDKAYISDSLGKPFSKDTKENDGGTVEFWIYKDIVKIAGTDKVYKYTQVGIVNNAVETVGNTNLSPE